MKKNVIMIWILLIFLSISSIQAQNNCSLFISSGSDPECIITTYDRKKQMDILENNQSECLIACQGSEVEYEAITPNTGNFVWLVEGAESYTFINQGSKIRILWGNSSSGRITVSLTTSSGQYCESSACITLIEKPSVASETVPPYFIENGRKVIEVCPGEEVHFINRSEDNGSPIVGHLWHSEQGDVSSEHFTTTFNTPGFTFINHKVWNECGCSDEEMYYIRVSSGETLQLSCYGTVCGGDSAVYTAENATCSSYQWSVQGGRIISGQNTPTINVEWDHPQSGYGILSLDGRYCNQLCSQPLTIKIPVISDAVAINGPDQVCAGEHHLFELPLWGGTTYNWSVLSSGGIYQRFDHESPNQLIVRFTQPGTYTIRGSYRCDFLECGPFEVTKQVIVGEKLEIEGPEKVCRNSMESFTSNANNSSTQWKIYHAEQEVHSATGSTLQYAFPNSGSYRVTASHPSYCNIAEFHVSVRENPPVPGTITGKKVCCPNSSLFVKATPTSPRYYLVWEPSCSSATPSFVEGNEATITYGTTVCNIHVYQVDAETGCRSSNKVHPVSAITPSAPNLPASITVCAGNTFSLQVPNQSPDIFYEWKINYPQRASVVGDHTSYKADFLVNYMPTLGSSYTFTVTLTRSYCNSSQNTSVIVHVTQTPPPTLTMDTTGCVGQSLSFTATGNSSVSSHYKWRIEDNELTGNTQQYAFQTPGRHAVELIYTPGIDCDPVVITKYVTIAPLPSATISVDNSGSTPRITVSGSPGGTYRWSYNGSVISSGTNATCTYRGVGNYCCTVTDVNACSNSDCLTVTDAPGGTCTGFPIQLNRNCNTVTASAAPPVPASVPVIWSTSTPSAIISTSSDTRSAVIEFRNPGYYEVYAEVTYGNIQYCGRGSVEIPCRPEFDLYYDCTDGSIKITDRSEFRAGLSIPVRNFSLRIGNGNISQNFNMSGNTTTGSFSVTPSTTTIYTVTMAIPTLNCTISKDITIVPPPANLAIDAPSYVCRNTPFDLSGSATGNNITYSWSFGDGSENRGANVSHTYSSATTYTIRLTATDVDGCSSTKVKSVQVRNNDLTGNLVVSGNNPECPGIVRSIQYTPAVTNSHYTWQHSTVNSNTVYIQNTGEYSVRVVSPNGCIAQKRINVPFRNKPQARILGKSEFCMGESIELNGNTGNRNTYTWSVKNPANQYTYYSTPAIRFEPGSSGNYTVSVNVNNGTCSNSVNRTVSVHSAPAAPVLQYDGTSCLHEPPVVLTAANNRDLFWSNGDFGPVAHYYRGGFATAYYMDPSTGCKSTEGTVYVDPAPNFGSLLTGCYEECDDFFPAHLTVERLLPDDRPWSWYYNNTLDTTGRTSSFRLPLRGFGDYYLESQYSPLCSAVSHLFSIQRKSDCGCNLSITDLGGSHCYTKDCKMYYRYNVLICNYENTTIYLDSIYTFYPTDFQINGLPAQLGPGKCAKVEFDFEVTDMSASQIDFFIRDNHNNCETSFSIAPDMEDCLIDCRTQDIPAQLTFIPGAVAGKYHFLFDFAVNSQFQLQQLWSEPENLILNYSTYVDNYDLHIEGILEIDVTEYNRMLQNGDSIFFLSVLCLEGKPYLCHGRAFATLTPVLPEENTCYDNLEVYFEGSSQPDMQGCDVKQRATFKICNRGNETVVYDSLYTISNATITSSDRLPIVINGHDCISFRITYLVHDPGQTSLDFVLYNSFTHCSDTISMEWDSEDIVQDCGDIIGKIYNIHFDPESPAAGELYFDFEFDFPDYFELLHLWTEPVDYIAGFSGRSDGNTRIINGKLLLDLQTWQRMVKNKEKICFHYTLCDSKKPAFCSGVICIPAEALKIPDFECCNLKFDVDKQEYRIEDCSATLSLTMKICDGCGSSHRVDRIVTSPDISFMHSGTWPIIIEKGKCSAHTLTFRIENPEAEFADITFINSLTGCKNGLRIDLDPSKFYEEDCNIHFTHPVLSYNWNLSEGNLHYLDFEFSSEMIHSLGSLWSSEVNVIYYDYAISSQQVRYPVTYRGTFSISEQRLKELAGNGDKICFHLSLCQKGYPLLCHSTVCFNVEDILDRIPRIEIKTGEAKCYTKNCQLYNQFHITIFNYGNSPFYLNSIESSSPFIQIQPWNSNNPILPGTSQTILLDYRILNPAVDTVRFTINQSHITFFKIADTKNCISNCFNFLKKPVYQFTSQLRKMVYYDFEYILDPGLYDISIVSNIGYISKISKTVSPKEIRIRGELAIAEAYLKMPTRRLCVWIIACNSDGKLCWLPDCQTLEFFEKLIPKPKNTVPGAPASPESQSAQETVKADHEPYLIPNPATDQVKIGGIPEDRIESVHLITMNGQEILSRKECSSLSIHSFAPGTYIVRIKTKDQQLYHLKLLKK